MDVIQMSTEAIANMNHTELVFKRISQRPESEQNDFYMYFLCTHFHCKQTFRPTEYDIKVPVDLRKIEDVHNIFY